MDDGTELSKEEKAHGMNPNQQTNQKIVDQVRTFVL